MTWVQDLTLRTILIQKKLSISPNCFIALKFISLVQLILVHSMRTGVCQCLQVKQVGRLLWTLWHYSGGTLHWENGTPNIVLSITLAFVAIVAQLLMWMPCHIDDLQPRFKTWHFGRYWNRKKLSIFPNCFIALKFISPVQLMLVHGMQGWLEKDQSGFNHLV